MFVGIYHTCEEDNKKSGLYLLLHFQQLGLRCLSQGLFLASLSSLNDLLAFPFVDFLFAKWTENQEKKEFSENVHPNAFKSKLESKLVHHIFRCC